MDNLDFNEAWKKINEEKFSSSNIKKEEIMNAISKESSSTISELKKRLKYKMNWVVFFLIGFIISAMLSLDNPVFLSIFCIGIVLYSFGALGIYSEYKKMDDHIDSSKDTLSEMKRHRDIMVRALTNESRWGVISFPIILITMTIAPNLAKGTPLMEIISDPLILSIIIGGVVLFTPFLLWATKKMNNKGYGSYIQKLEDNIKKMEEL